MKYFATFYDYAPTNPLVSEQRPAHREFINSLHEKGLIVGSGPHPDSAGGALIILQLDDDAQVADAIKIMNDDPFHTSGVVTRRSFREWNPVTKIF